MPTWPVLPVGGFADRPKSAILLDELPFEQLTSKSIEVSAVDVNTEGAGVLDSSQACPSLFKAIAYLLSEGVVSAFSSSASLCLGRPFSSC